MHKFYDAQPNSPCVRCGTWVDEAEDVSCLSSSEVVVVFTRHKLTDEQASEVRRITDSAKVVSCSDLAAEQLFEVEDAQRVLGQIIRRANSEDITIFGVIPPIIRAILLERDGAAEKIGVSISIFEAHNTSRSPEGGAGTFTFACWLPTGDYAI